MNNKGNVAVREQAVFIWAVILTVLSAAALAVLFQAISPPIVPDSSILIEAYKGTLRPEHTEKAVFMVLGLLIPACLLLAAFRNGNRAQTRGSAAASIVLAAFFLYPFARFEFGPWLLAGHKRIILESLLTLSLAFIVAVTWFFYGGKFQSRTNSAIGQRVSWAVFLSAMLLQILAWRVTNENRVMHWSVWNVHFDAVIYAVGQVVGGKTVLADLPSQYGLFPEFIAPVFRVIKLSVFNFLAFFAVMQVISMTSVMWVVHRFVRDPAIRVVTAIAFVMVTFQTIFWILGFEERYLQYWPIRFFWPALSVLTFYWYSRKPTLSRSAIVSIVGAVGALWNMDTGIMILLAFGAFLAVKWIMHAGLRTKIMLALCLHVGVFVTISALVFSYLSLKSTTELHWSWLYEYQRVFYNLGFYMIPIPKFPHAWMAVMGVYVLGMTVAFHGMRRYPGSRAMANILFISFLGVGLFVYFQGRSHVLNLITVSWPAVVLSAILADRTARAVRAGLLSRANLVLPSAALAVLIFCGLPFVKNVPKFYNDAVAAIKNRKVVIDPTVKDEIRFVKSHSKRGDECLILSQRQGIYYALAGLTSPIIGPGYVETILRSDLVNMIEQIKAKKPKCVFLGVAASSALDLEGMEKEALKDYSELATSNLGTMKLLGIK